MSIGLALSTVPDAVRAQAPGPEASLNERRLPRARRSVAPRCARFSFAPARHLRGCDTGKSLRWRRAPPPQPKQSGVLRAIGDLPVQRPRRRLFRPI
jgi:hypothetical protein